ncbi:peptidase S24/S26A/S26B/S26C [Geopyxis carbonaria]|nr:peptidase S24/S26A/S26B/S26C [Geopyxis carbonaria]
MISSQIRIFKGAAQYAFFLHLFWDKFYCCGDSVGVSMLPTFAVSGDWVFTSKLHCYGRGCKVGDVVSYVHPLNGPGVNVMKRIIGMPGDFVVRDPTDGTGDMLQVPKGHIWTTGDNIPHSHDSRFYGPVPMGLVRGKVIAKCSGGSWFDWKFSWIENPLD